MEKAKTVLTVGAMLGGIAGILLFWSFVGTILMWITAQINAIVFPIVVAFVLIGLLVSLLRR